MTKWIDVEKQLPDDDGKYLAFWGTIFIAVYTKTTNKWERENRQTGLNQRVSHWMPLPKPPSKKES